MNSRRLRYLYQLTQCASLLASSIVDGEWVAGSDPGHRIEYRDTRGQGAVKRKNLGVERSSAKAFNRRDRREKPQRTQRRVPLQGRMQKLLTAENARFPARAEKIE